MVVVLALIGVAVLVTAAAPLLLARGSWRVRHPGVALALWLVAFAVGALSLLGSLATAAVIVMAKLHTAWLGAFAPTAASLFVWVGLGATGALIALAVTRSEPMSEAQRSTDSAAVLLAARARYRVERVGRQHVTYVRDERLLACCTADGRILISSALEGALPARRRSLLERHLAACPHCSTYLEQIRVTIAALGRVDADELPAETRDGLVALYRSYQSDPG